MSKSSGPLWNAAFRGMENGRPERYLTMLDSMGDELDEGSASQLTTWALRNEKFSASSQSISVVFDEGLHVNWLPPACLQAIDAKQSKFEAMDLDEPRHKMDFKHYGKAANRVISYPEVTCYVPKFEAEAKLTPKRKRTMTTKEKNTMSEPENQQTITSFITAKSEMLRQSAAKGKAPPAFHQNTAPMKPKFTSPYISNNQAHSSSTDSEIKGIDPKLIEIIESEIMDTRKILNWKDIAGLKTAKDAINYAVIAPMKRPDLFTGIRSAPKGVLLFGPPGTGKTLIGKCIASQAGATFFSISASSMTSKWIGEGEKLVKVLFHLARKKAPSVIFVDEIDSLLSARSEGEHEASRRIKTEFLVQLDGCREDDSGKVVLLIGATNRPECLDEAARRRLTRRLYIPLPCGEARRQIMENLIKDQPNTLTSPEFQLLVENTEGYSGSDLNSLCREAALTPMKEIMLENLDIAALPPIKFNHFQTALSIVRPSVEDSEIVRYEEFQKKFGC